MANMTRKLNLSALNINTVKADSRKPITSAAVARPVREIRANVSNDIRAALMETIFTNILLAYGKPTYAKGASWLVDHDDCARLLRVHYNTHLAEKGEKMDSAGARELWSQIYGQANPDGDAPVFSDSDNADSEKDD